MSIEVYAAQPREGTETKDPRNVNNIVALRGLCSSTPRGDGNFGRAASSPLRFPCGLCSSTPRGDGNPRRVRHQFVTNCDTVYAAQPREGTETRQCTWSRLSARAVLVYAAQPREGTETIGDSKAHTLPICQGLCSSTPRGDGNQEGGDNESPHNQHKVYAAQPREGTETIRIFLRS